VSNFDGNLDSTYLETLAGLHERQIARFNERRRIEWRMTFTLWGGLILAASVLADLSLRTWTKIVIAVAVVIVVIFHAVWEVLYVARGAVSNRDEGIRLENLIREKIGIDLYKPNGYMKWAAHYWQVGVTFMIGWLVMVAILN